MLLTGPLAASATCDALDGHTDDGSGVIIVALVNLASVGPPGW